MGLYLCIFDPYGEELRGVEVGMYHYFDVLRRRAERYVREKKVPPQPTQRDNPDCDGVWSVKDCKQLLKELEQLRQQFLQEPPDPEVIRWKEEVFRLYGITPADLSECFVDADCEPLLDRLISLCGFAIEEKRPIEFQ